MSSTLFHIMPCTLLDVPEMVTLYLSAFSPDPINQAMLPPTCSYASKRAWVAARYEGIFKKPEMHMFKAVETETGTMAAWCR